MRGADSSQAIPYGTESFELSLPQGELVARLEPAAVAAAPAEEIIRDALEHPVGSPRLRELARGKRSAAILVPGKDRVAAASSYLPLLLEELNDAGIADEQIMVTLATGTHARHTPEEVARILGEETVSRVRWREHDCKADERLRQIGVTSYGTDVAFDQAVLDADVKVLTGRIIPHYFAGFGGGRKALLPGVASLKTILQNHSLTLARTGGIHPHVRPCSLSGNPVHLDMLEAARLVKPVFVLNTLLDTRHHVVGAVAGELEAAHQAGCAQAERTSKLEVEEPLDAVITSAGGWPYDCDFVQGLKAVFNVQEVLRPGGAMLWIARCPGGMKEKFLRWAAIESDEELEGAVRADYDLAGHNSIMLRKLTGRVRVALWSELPGEDVRGLGLEPVHSLEAGVDWLLGALPDGFRYGVVPFGNVTYVTTSHSRTERAK